MLVFFFGTFVVATLIMVGGACRAPRFVMDPLTRAFGYVVLSATLTRVEHVKWYSCPQTWPERVVVVSNHESHLDGPGVQTTLSKRSIRYVAKQSLFKIPFLGWGLRAAGNVPVSRQGRKSDHHRLNESDERSKDGDVLFFAEGTRSRDGALHPFKKGAFYFAITHGRPIVPVAVCGGFEVMPAGGLRPQKGNLALCVGAPIDVSAYGREDAGALRDRVAAEVTRLRAEALGLIHSPRAEETRGGEAARGAPLAQSVFSA
jgi:1-acyl-sn-glycerol-3-phosphate acyltransferase